MTKQEWLDIGMEKGIIDTEEYVTPPFHWFYHEWFKIKLTHIKRQSADRIECTWNKYFLKSDFVTWQFHTINENMIAAFINKQILDYNLTRKEYLRIYQILHEVFEYTYDFHLKIYPHVNFEVVKKYVNTVSFVDNINDNEIVYQFEYDILYHAILHEKIYSLKQSQSLLLLLNFYLGLRVGELASLRFADFDLLSGVVYIHQTQTKYHNRDADGHRTGTMSYDVESCCKTITSVRVVPLCDKAISIYQEIVWLHRLKDYHSEYLCYDGADTIRTRSLDRTLTRLCKLCHLRHIKTHAIRKTLATRLHQKGTPTRYISDILGHKEISTTEKYYIKSEKDYTEVKKYLNAVFQ